MAGMRAVVSVKATRGGSSSSGVARYIAESKRDEEREGKGARLLFNFKDERLTYRAANRLLSPDRDGPSQRDIIHLVISPAKGEYERLGSNEEERMAAFREATRETMKDVEKALRKYFGKRGERVVQDNLACVKRGYSEMKEIPPPMMVS